MRPTRLALAALEDRSLLTAWGIPWPDPEHLSLSFALDGTSTPYGPSGLTQELGQNTPSASWQREIVRAFQTWAVQANINVGLRSDSGLPLGTAGIVQGDSRFGDVRVAAAPLSSTHVADAAPFSWSGTTLSGDLVFNGDFSFRTGNYANTYDVFSVALHEAGHVFGLDHSPVAGSVMNETYNYRTGLTAGDVASLRALYGARTPDSFEGSLGNNTLARATPLARDGLLFNRFTAVGDLTTGSDVDFYKFTVAPLLGLTGVAVRLQAAGISLLAPRVTVYNAAGQAIASAQSADPMTNDLLVQFTPSLLGGTYYVKVEKATADVFGVGGYRVAADYLSLGSILEPLGPLLSPVVDLHSNDLLGLATILSPRPQTTDARFDFTYRGVIEDGWDVDHYRFRAPRAPAAGSLTLDVLVWGLEVNGLDPRIAVFTAAGTPVAFQVLANDAGLMAVQIPDASPGLDYVVAVKARAAGGNTTGGYFLAADFNQFARTTFDGVAAKTLAPGTADAADLTINEAAVYEFALDARMIDAGLAAGVTMTVTDAAGQVVLTLDVDAGKPAVTAARYLRVGTYQVTYRHRPVPGAPTGDVQYSLFLLQVTDGVGPYPPQSGGGSGSSGTTRSGGYTYSGSSTTRPSGNYYYF